MKALVRDPYTQEVVEAEPVQLPGPAADDGYSATKVGYNGAARTALVLHYDARGITHGSLVVKDGTLDVHRAEQIAMYARQKRERAQRQEQPK